MTSIAVLPVRISLQGTLRESNGNVIYLYFECSTEARSISMNNFNATVSEMSFDDRHTDEGIGYLPW